VPMKQETDTGVLPAHCENGGDTSDTRWLPTLPILTLCVRCRGGEKVTDKPCRTVESITGSQKAVCRTGGYGVDRPTNLG